MTTPSTAELRAWARANGIAVADRGRVSGDVLTAWQSSQPRGRAKRRSTAMPSTSRPSAARQAGRRTSVGQEPSTPEAMARQLAALTERVQRLETRLAGKQERERKKQKK